MPYWVNMWTYRGVGFLLLWSVFCRLLARLPVHGESLQYTQEFLLLLRNARGGSVDPNLVFPEEIIQPPAPTPGAQSWIPPRARRKRGHRKIPLPSIMLANVQSLRNKVDEVQAHVRFLEEYRDVCILAFTETWLKEHVSQDVMEIDGFGAPFRLDRDPTVTGKSLGGGLCLYINKRWCSTVIIRESLCTPDIELLAVSLRPFYLSREFPKLFVTVVYIHPRANADIATQTMSKTVQSFQARAPDAPIFF